MYVFVGVNFRIPPRPMDPMKDLAVYGAVQLHGKTEWRSGRTGIMRDVRWLSMKDMVEMILMVLIYPSRCILLVILS